MGRRGLCLCSTHGSGAGGMRLLPKCNATAAALGHSPSAPPALLPGQQKLSGSALLPWPRSKERRSGRLHALCAASASPVQGSGGAPFPATRRPGPCLRRSSETSAAWDGWVRFPTLRSCSTCGTAPGVREQPEDGRCLCEDGRRVPLGRGPPAQHLLSPPPPFSRTPPSSPGCASCSLLIARPLCPLRSCRSCGYAPGRHRAERQNLCRERYVKLP